MSIGGLPASGPSTGRSGDASRARRLAGLAIVGIVAYLVIDAALRFLEPQYSLFHNAESDYGNGAFGWLMDVDFLLRGGLSLAVVAAVVMAVPRGRWLWAGLTLVAVWAVASALLAFFPDDLAGHASTAGGRVHLALALVAFLAMAAGAMCASVGLFADPRAGSLRGWLAGLAVAGIVALLLVGRPLIRADGGLFERIFLALELAWLLLLAISIQRGWRASADPPGR